MFNIQKGPSKITIYGVNLQKEKGRKSENDPKTKMKRGIFHNHQENLIIGKVSKVTKRSRPRLGKLLSFAENLKN